MLFFFRLPASEKPAEELFFESTDLPSADPKPLSRKEIRGQPLASELKLKSSSAVKGFQSQPRRSRRKSDSIACMGSPDSSDEEFDGSASYRAISDEQRDRLASRAKQHPMRSTLHLGCRDLWEEGE